VNVGVGFERLRVDPPGPPDRSSQARQCIAQQFSFTDSRRCPTWRRRTDRAVADRDRRPTRPRTSSHEAEGFASPEIARVLVARTRLAEPRYLTSLVVEDDVIA
jgi:hypothetical protein